jgi:hypothetical protein
MIRLSALICVCLTVITWPAAAQEYHVAKLESAPPADALAPEIATLLSPTGLKIGQGDSRVVCEVWLCKEWSIAADAKTTAEIQFPFTPGQVLGVCRFPRKASDFRDQEVPAGVYVLRYAQQPVDGNHVGTFPTRDFAALLPAAKDRSAGPLDYKMLTTLAKETTGTAHPAIRPLLKPAADAPAVRSDEEKQWTMVRLVGKTKAGAAVQELAMELVVAGVAAE